MAVTVPTDRRFLRRDTRASRPSRLRTRWWWVLIRATVVLGILTAAGYQAAVAIWSTPALTVRHITLSGNRRLTSDEAQALLDGLVGEHLLLTDLDTWRERLLASSWVADAEFRRQLPATIVVHVTEREPVGIARLGRELYLVDDSGGIIDAFGPRYADCDLPIIDGLLVPGPSGSTVDETRSRLVAAMMTDLARRPDLSRRVSQIDVSDVYDLQLILEGDPAVLRLGTTRFLDRLWSYIGLQEALRQRVPEMNYVDLRFDDRVYVGPMAGVQAVPGAATPETTLARAADPSVRRP